MFPDENGGFIALIARKRVQDHLIYLTHGSYGTQGISAGKHSLEQPHET